MAIVNSKLHKLDRRIIKSKKQDSLERTTEEEAIPFIPAMDLWEAKKDVLSEEEISSIGLALYLLTPNADEENKSDWARQGRIEGVSGRF